MPTPSPAPTARRALAALTLVALTCLSSSALAAPGPESAADGLLKLVAVLVLLVAVGFGLGSFGLTVNNLFRQRSALTFGVMCSRPKLSLATGVAVTLLGLVLLAVLKVAPPLQLLVMVAYLGALGLFALGGAARLAGQHVEPAPLNGELPGARAHVKGGVVLTAVNAVPIMGTVLFLGILLAGVGASLLAYFAHFSGPVGTANQSAEPQPDAPRATEPQPDAPRVDEPPPAEPAQ